MLSLVRREVLLREVLLLEAVLLEAALLQPPLLQPLFGVATGKPVEGEGATVRVVFVRATWGFFFFGSG